MCVCVCVCIHMCVAALCVDRCAFFSPHMCYYMFNELEATTLHFQMGALFVRACSTV